jgi:uncharacterized coiled-coil protein SlyX
MNRFVQDLYEKLPIRCVNAGCSETFPWPKKAQHEDVCAFAPKVECEHCHEMVVVKFLEAHHKDTCSMYPVACKLKCCKEMVPRSQMREHMRDFSEQHLVMMEAAHHDEILKVSAQQSSIARLEDVVAAQRTAISRLEAQVMQLHTGMRENTTKNTKSPMKEQNPCIVFRGHCSDVYAIALSESEMKLYSGSKDCTIKVWHLVSGTLIASLEEHRGNVWCIALSNERNNERNRLFSGSGDKTIKVWDTVTLQCLHTLQGHRQTVFAIVYDDNLNRLYSGSSDKTIKVWDLTTFACIHTFVESHQERVTCLALANGHLYSGSLENSIKVWNTATYECVATMEGHFKCVYSLCLSEDDRRLYSGSQDKTIKVWDTATNTCIATLRGHTNTIFSLCFCSRTNRLISSGSAGKEIRIWETTYNTSIHKFEEPHDGSIWSMVLSESSGTLYSASKDETIKGWHL